jgi:hypothetical protein
MSIFFFIGERSKCCDNQNSEVKTIEFWNDTAN